MAVAYRGVGYDSGSGTSLFAVPPDGCTDGDLIFLHIGIEGTATPTVTGWDLLDSISGTNSIYVYTKVADSEPVEYEFELSASDDYVAMTTGWYSDTADPLSVDVFAHQTNGASGTATYPSVTMSVANEVAICFASYTTRSGFSMSPNGGFTERYEEGSTTGCVYCMSKVITGTGATGTFTSSSTITISSKTVTVALSDALPTGPETPIGLTATVTNDDAITVTWSDESSDEDYFVLERSPDGFTWTPIATLPPNTTTYTNTGLAPNTQYCYRVGAGNDSGVNYSNSDCGTTGASPQLRYDIAIRISFDWDRDGTYTDEQDYVVSAKGSQRVAPASQSITASQGQVAQCTIVLDNSTGRFSSMNTGGALYAYIGEGKAYQVPVDVEIAVVPAGDTIVYTSVFQGFARIPSEATLSPGQAKTITFDCRSKEDILMNKKLRTSQADFKAYRDSGVTEAEFIADLVADAAPDLTLVADDGLVMLPWAYLENESVLETIWQLCAATGGRFYGSPDGTVNYENAAHWLYDPHDDSVYSYTRGSGFQSLELFWNDTEIAEEASVGWTEKEIAQPDVIYDSDRIIVPAGETVTIYGDFSAPAYEITGIVTTAGTNGGVDLSADVTVDPTYYAQSAKLEIENTGSIQANVRVKISGKVAEDSDSQTVSNTSGDSFWTDRVGRSRKVTGNRWVQSEGQANMLLDFIRNRQVLPTLTAKMKGCPGNNYRKIGDRVTITDSEVSLTATDFWVTSLSWTYSSKGYFQEIEGARCTDLYPHVDAAPGYFIIGTNVLGSAETFRGRCFF